MATDISQKYFAVAAPPHWHCGRTLPGLMVDTIIALMPAAIAACLYYGFDAVRVMALACSTAVVTEALCMRLMKRDVSVDDYSALVTGLLFAFMLPAGAPWWLVLIGSAISIVLGKMIFGGLGGNPLPSAVIGWAVLKISWATPMDVDATMLSSALVNPLGQLKYFGLQYVTNTDPMNLLLGKQLGALGASQPLWLALGGVFLILRKRINWIIPVSFLAGAVGVGSIFYGMDSAVYASPIFHLLAGGTVFGAFFLSTDHASSPVGKLPMVIYGLLGGAMVIIIRTYGIYPDGVPFAVMLACLFTPLLDLIRPKSFGAR